MTRRIRSVKLDVDSDPVHLTNGHEIDTQRVTTITVEVEGLEAPDSAVLHDVIENTVRAFMGGSGR